MYCMLRRTCIIGRWRPLCFTVLAYFCLHVFYLHFTRMFLLLQQLSSAADGGGSTFTSINIAQTATRSEKYSYDKQVIPTEQFKIPSNPSSSVSGGENEIDCIGT
ncbi:hypothetical protein K402DRAFT_85632 [Aulographum hederae CBS 113979]|uniref:Uncharacterized protein n=1 Tax=Aulographum hederae CBS 113979 TaxID=1176131 RepID=A0A6G1H0U8_9PEZI|nr:hypothetical protein K402DRAFT_85632 [Aulographum hederae CBS 113979]